MLTSGTRRSQTVDTDQTRQSQRKGRPTPTRKRAQARNSKPLVPADRKEAKHIARTKRDAAFQHEWTALKTGDERYLPLRDKGQVCHFIRDSIDARWTLSEFLLPVMVFFLVAMIAASLVPSWQETIGTWVMISMTGTPYVLFAVSILEGVIVWQRLKKPLKKRFPNEEILKGSWYYCYSRMIMARCRRSPRPLVARGEFPGVKNKG